MIEWEGLGSSAGALCVYCRQKPAEPAWRPFCSERCKMADLGRWLGGEYRVPINAPDPPLEDEDPHTIEPSLDLILVARHLERIGDHATNIAEDVIFMVSAKDVRHHSQ